jgi:hypothetical protein
MPVLAAEPGKSDVALERHQAAIAAAAQPTSDIAIDPELMRKLEEFRAERERDDAA